MTASRRNVIESPLELLCNRLPYTIIWYILDNHKCAGRYTSGYRTPIYRPFRRSVLSSVTRIECPECGTLCIEQEKTCWQCGDPLHTLPVENRNRVQQEDSPVKSLADGLI